jgi:glycosyltransferase involved in cell wall biosynthesis
VFPYAVLEALAVGSPVVSTRWKGVEEVLSDGETGWLAELESPSSLAATIDRALGDRRSRERVAAAGWEHCSRFFSREEIARRSIEFYSRVIEKRDLRTSC